MRKPIKPTATFSEVEKASITAACERLIGEFLRPRFLPVIRPTEFNYPVDILGKWRGANYRFIQRYRSGWEENKGEEFDAPFTRLDRVGPDRFDIYWMRHTGKWWRIHQGVSLAEALKLIETEKLLHPA